MMRAFILSLLIACAGLAPNLLAHQQKESYSSILFNPRSGLIEVAHRFYLHDAEHAIKRGGIIAPNSISKSADLAKSESMQAAFAQYIVASFAIRALDQEPEALELVGYEVEGKYLWVYQQTKLAFNISEIWVKMTALQGIWSGQTNHVNVEINKNTYSVRLKRGDEWQKILLSEQAANE
ncbi:DUF6702 family protein [Aliikangiella sp. IMCC44653]